MSVSIRTRSENSWACYLTKYYFDWFWNNSVSIFVFYGVWKEPLSHEKLLALNQFYRFGETQNWEILFRWLRLGLKAKWPAIIQPALKFVTDQGRMKFTRPIYKYNLIDFHWFQICFCWEVGLIWIGIFTDGRMRESKLCRLLTRIVCICIRQRLVLWLRIYIWAELVDLIIYHLTKSFIGQFFFNLD